MRLFTANRVRGYRLWVGATVAILTLGVSACAPPADTASGTGSAPSSLEVTPNELSGSLNVYAAASLKTTFTTLASEFESAHPHVKVSVSFDGSSTLVTQIIQGAPADVFASADTANMTKLSEAGLTGGSPTDFASNVLTLVVPPNNPANISSFSDVSKPGVKLVVCAPQVPCGSATVSDAASAGLSLTPVSEELSVTSVLGKVISGEADAGLVYVTDAKKAGDKVRSIPLELAKQTVNHYPIASVKDSKNAQLAQAFISLVTSDDGQKVLRDAGFGAP
ncbi:molybdate ABC transporter substrate-binding protein [Arthrobacter antibioticus]|uniref:molybdate ABC transporter substrate-binding protein n=1 Tax=Arthrobacter sp. H35-MC1 TaxID=3046203 RepID=UPI0024BA0AA7|nr:molybdate ABC transporter substrate-binding protein [Arthrobacter sp. H35-MC1]MDJ0316544.1 molybdate ABC transporter substrate-binding protein [Arthrobacter sp. H35-MC1]